MDFTNYQHQNHSEFFSQPNSEYNNSSNKENMYQSQSINSFGQSNSQNPFSKIALSDSQYDHLTHQLSKTEKKKFQQQVNNINGKQSLDFQQQQQSYQNQQQQLQSQGQRVAFGALKPANNFSKANVENVNPLKNNACLFQKPQAKVFQKNGKPLPNIFAQKNNEQINFNNVNIQLNKPRLKQITSKNIYLVPQYQDQILENMKLKAQNEFTCINYLDIQEGKDQAFQTEFTESERVIVVNFIHQQFEKFTLLPQTYFLSVKIFDSVLQKQPIQVDHLQAVALTSLFISSKIEEIYPPDLYQFVETTDGYCSTNEIIHLEGEIIQLIGFDFTYPTPLFFLESILYNNQLKFERIEKTFCYYLLELGSYNYNLLKFNPLEIALGAIFYTYKLKGGTQKAFEEISIVKQFQQPFSTITKVAKMFATQIFLSCQRKNQKEEEEYEDLNVNIKFSKAKFSGISELIQKICKKERKLIDVLD